MTTPTPSEEMLHAVGSMEERKMSVDTAIECAKDILAHLKDETPVGTLEDAIAYLIYATGDY
jgi:hypothetical protein